jgi:hypothetical protein
VAATEEDVNKVSTRSTITIYSTRIRKKVCEVSTHNYRDEKNSSLNACTDFFETADGNLPPPDFQFFATAETKGHRSDTTVDT